MTSISSSLLPTISAHPATLGRPSRRLAVGARRQTLLALLAVAAILTVFLAGAIMPERRPLSSLGSVLPWQSVLPPDVPMFRGNPEHTGESPGPNPTQKPEVLWQVKTGAQIKTSPALVNGVLYLGSLDGNIYALDHATGEERWRFDTSGSPEAPPTVADGSVFVGDNNPWQSDGALFVLDAATGEERWRLQDAQTSAPLVVDGILYTGTSDGILHAYEAADGTELWSVETGALSRGVTLANDLLYYGTKDGTVYARDPADGAERWRYQTEGGQLGTIAAGDGMVYETAFDGPADQLYALNATTGEEQWRFDINARVQTPVVSHEAVYLPGGDGSVYALDAATGTVRWRFDYGNPTVFGPVLVGDTLYITGGSSSLYSVDANSGTERWHIELDGALGASPIVTGGVIYATTNSGSIYALGERADDPPIVLPAATNAESSEDPVEFLWAASNGSEPIDPMGGIAQAPDDSIWVIDGSASRFLIFSPDGAVRETWGQPGPSEGEFNFFLENCGGSYGDIGFDRDGNIYVLDSGNHRVQKFDRTRRFVKSWATSGTDDAPSQCPVTMTVDSQGNVYVVDDGRGVIEKFSSDGIYLATISSRGTDEGQTECIAAFGIDNTGILYVPDCWRHEIQTFSPDGEFLAAWGSEGSDKGEFTFPTEVVIDAAGHIFVTDSGNNRVQVFDSDGKFMTSWGSFGSGKGEFNGTGNLVLDGAGNIYVQDGNGRIQKFRLLPPLAP